MQLAGVGVVCATATINKARGAGVKKIQIVLDSALIASLASALSLSASTDSAPMRDIAKGWHCFRKGIIVLHEYTMTQAVGWLCQQ
jgi:hypothetical protein